MNVSLRLAWLSALLSVCPPLWSAGLQPFRLPYNDAAASAANLQGWQSYEAGSLGFIKTTEDGHYLEGSHLIKFIGVNITAAGAFPSHALADAHAARLAKFGFNAVRFHHMEAPWDKSNVIIDYSTGTSRVISTERLERLHYFVNALASHGIYSNINLLVSREFQAGDGLGSEITQLGWKDQHVLGFFYDAALALHKEHATNLLTAPNPYRGGKSLAEDPAVAFVEIMNENGFLQKWYEGVLDTLPPTYLAALKVKWNAWLAAKYANDAELLAAWKSVDQPLGPNTLSNADFSGGTTGWNLEQLFGAQASLTTNPTGYNTKPSATVSVTKAGTEGWHVQLTHGGLSLTAGKLYTLSFAAKASAATPISATLTRTGPSDYSGVMNSLAPTLTTTWTTYSVTFQGVTDEPQLRLVFNNFGNRLATVSLADVRLSEGGKIGGLPDGVSLAAQNIPTVLRNPGANAPTAEQRADWVRYIFSAEKAYWNTMYAHVKTTLGYKGLVWGSIISNSPTNEQSDLDALDSHAYWQHPSWPAGQEWDPVNWTVANVSMVNYPDANTLGGIARQRVNGKAHNVTEYQHPSPNTYASEGPVLAATYGALQDWDSLWMFEYTTGTSEYVSGFFDHGGHAGKMVNNLLAAALFRRGDVKHARRNYDLAMTPEKEVLIANTIGGAWNIADGGHLGVSQSLAAESRLSLNIGEAATGLSPVPSASATNPIVSDTGEVKWDTSVANKGVVTVSTAKTKAAIGFVNGRTFTLGDVEIKPGTTRLDWCTIGITLTGGASFTAGAGAHGLIVATGDQENTGQIWKDASKNSIGSNWGTAPVLVEVIPATITLPVAAARVHAWALDGTGQRTTALTVGETGGKASLTLGANGTTLWYEFQIDAGETSAPVVTREPLAAVATTGDALTLDAGIDGYPTPTYQWFKDGVAVDGATSPTLSIGAVSAGDEGIYRLEATNVGGTAVTRDVRVALRENLQSTETKLVNVSTRAPVGTGAAQVIAGFVVRGPRQVLIRGIGPKLAAFGVPGVLTDPMLTVIKSGETEPRRVNDDWVSSELSAASASVGAFSISDSPKEAGALLSLDDGNYTATLSGKDSGTGVGLVEVYDTGVGSGRIVNLSTRGTVGSGGNSLFVGFVVRGASPKHILIRGVGPTLELFSLTGVVADPTLQLYEMTEKGAKPLLANDDWQDTQGATIRTSAAVGGAFPLSDTGRDASIDAWLEPGRYSAQMESKGADGLGLVEVYEIQ